MTDKGHSMRPGHGWKRLSGSVWEHTSGARIHLSGLVRLPDMAYRHLNKRIEGSDGRRFVQINGGNRKRGMTAWARRLAEPGT